MFRRRAGLSQASLAKHLGVSSQQLQKYENGRDRMAVSTLLFIAETLDLPLQVLVSPAEDETTAGVDSVRADHIVAFSRIADARVQRRITDLVKAIAGDSAADRP